jgi:hypothetical protein
MATKNLPFYNVTQSVGKSGVNLPEDVMLVRFLLSEVSKKGPLPSPPPTTPLLVNTDPAPPLVDWIEWFQKSVKQSGKVVIVDGRIDRATGVAGDMYATQHTICHLNVSYRKRFRANHNALENAPNCPALLKLKFAATDFN